MEHQARKSLFAACLKALLGQNTHVGNLRLRIHTVNPFLGQKKLSDDIGMFKVPLELLRLELGEIDSTMV